MVEEKIVNIESENENEIKEEVLGSTEERNKQIDKYLSMNNEEYINKEEYNIEGNSAENPESKHLVNSDELRAKENELQQKIKYIGSPNLSSEKESLHEGERVVEDGNNGGMKYRSQEDNEGFYERKGEEAAKENEEGEGEEREDEEIKHAGLQTIFIEEKSQHILNYVVEGYQPEEAIIDIDPGNIETQHQQEYGNSPIQENDAEEYSTNNINYPDLEDRTRLYQLANEIKKKDQGRKFVLWETNELRNNWDEKLYSNMKK